MPLFGNSSTASSPVSVDPALAYKILTDYDGYSEWLTGVSASKLLAKEGDLAIADLQMGDSDHDLAVECIHTLNQSVLIRKISGEVPVRQIVWSLQAGGEGQATVSVRVDGEPGWKNRLLGLPRPWRGRTLLRALESRAKVVADDPLAGSGQKILEIAEGAQGLELKVMGKRYRLEPLPEGDDV